jgi:hypothetical protein
MSHLQMPLFRLFAVVLTISIVGWLVFPYALILTVGLFLPVYLLSINAVIYLAPLVLIASRRSATSRQVLAFTVAGVCAVAILPGAASWYGVWRDRAELEATDTDTLEPVNHKSLELIFAYSSRTGRQSETQATPCEQICQKLLLSDDARSVTVRIGHINLETSSPITYRKEHRQTCPVVSYNKDQLLPVTEMLSRRGTCIVPYIGEPAPEEVLTISQLTANGQFSYIETIPANSRPAAKDGSVRRLEISEVAPSGGQKTLYRQTELKARIRTVPFFMTVDGGFGFQVSLVASSSIRTFNELQDLQHLLTKRLGYTLTPDMTELPKSFVMEEEV